MKLRKSARNQHHRKNRIEFEALEPRRLLCTFRAAINASNAYPTGGTEIQFAGHQDPGFVTGGGKFLVTSEGDHDSGCSGTAGAPVNTITVNSQLPVIVNSTTINGNPNSIPGTTYSLGSAPEVEIVNGAGVQNGLFVTGNHTKISGLIIRGFTDHGIILSGSQNQIHGNYIGTNYSGSAADSNGANGIYVLGSNNRIGRYQGSSGWVSDGNLISGNLNGIFIGDGASNEIYFNFIGTNADGTGSIANGNGIVVGAFAPGLQTIHSNVISGNTYNGVITNHAVAANSQFTSYVNVFNNRIGTNRFGAASVANANGVVAKHNVRVNDNVISGNTFNGVMIYGSDTHVTNNLIGVAADGFNDVPNQQGVLTTRVPTSPGQFTTAKQFKISGNTISGNNGAGIHVRHSTQDAINNLFDTVDGYSFIQNNKIGVNSSANARVDNGQGIFINREANFVVVGQNPDSPAANQGNIVAGNTGNGITVASGIAGGPTIHTNAAHVYIRDNMVGFTPSNSNTNIGNGRIGIEVQDSQIEVSDNQVGNNGRRFEDLPLHGIVLSTSAATNNWVYANHVGVNANLQPVPNGGSGLVLINGAHDNYIGYKDASRPGAGNIIGRNLSNGVYIGNGSYRNILGDNSIGTNLTAPNGQIDLGNSGYGILIENSDFNTIGRQVIVGSSTGLMGKGNAIAFNGQQAPFVWAGIRVHEGFGNEIHQNSIHDNVGPGIQLFENGNHNQAAPVLNSSYSVDPSGMIRVSGTINTGVAGQKLVVEFYHSLFTGGDVEGHRYSGAAGPGFGSGFVNDNGNGTYSFSNVLVDRAPNQWTNVRLTATATLEGGTLAGRSIGDTSQFSNAIVVPDGPSFPNGGNQNPPGQPPAPDRATVYPPDGDYLSVIAIESDLVESTDKQLERVRANVKTPLIQELVATSSMDHGVNNSGLTKLDTTKLRKTSINRVFDTAIADFEKTETNTLEDIAKLTSLKALAF